MRLLAAVQPRRSARDRAHRILRNEQKENLAYVCYPTVHGNCQASWSSSKAPSLQLSLSVLTLQLQSSNASNTCPPLFHPRYISSLPCASILARNSGRTSNLKSSLTPDVCNAHTSPRSAGASVSSAPHALSRGSARRCRVDCGRARTYSACRTSLFFRVRSAYIPPPGSRPRAIQKDRSFPPQSDTHRPMTAVTTAAMKEKPDSSNNFGT